jgi:hypothetical protein
MAGSVVAAVLTGCGGRESAANPRSPEGYLDHALQLIEQNSVYAPTLDWSPIADDARKMSARAKTPRGTYQAIRYAVGTLQDAGDKHAAFLEPAEAKQSGPGTPAFEAASPPPSVSMLNSRLGLIRMPPITSAPSSANSRRYASTALTSIRRLDGRRHPCGWVVDLRKNTGGDMFPMLLSVGPIVGEGDLIGFRGRHGFEYFVSYREGGLSGGGSTFPAPVRVPDLRPRPAVAVLTGEQTASSGEVVTVAFRGRPETRSFGSPTSGATTAAQWYRLADGAVLRLGVSYYVDRNRVVYKHGVIPDVDATFFGSPGDPQMRAAAAWLLARPRCTHA